jgi:type I restriction enzyme S subunit
MNFPPADAAVFALRHGDVLVTEASGSASAVGATAMWNGELEGTVCFQNTLIRLRPGRRLTGRYLFWWAMSQHATGAFAEAATGQSIRHLGAEALGDQLISVPPLEEQRRIADFLDAQSARIASLAEARRRERSLWTQSFASLVDEKLVPWRGTAIPLRYLTSKIGSGKTPSGGAEVYVDQGVIFLRSQNVHNDGLHLDDVAFIKESVDVEMHGTRVQPGDVLLNITGASIGRSCAVPVGLGAANVNQHVCIVRPLAFVESTLLAFAITGSHVQDEIRLNQVGGNRDGLNFDQVAGLTIPIPRDLRDQRKLTDELNESRDRVRVAGVTCDRSSDLIREYERSLITAAVTGEFDVTTARTGVPS